MSNQNFDLNRSITKKQIVAVTGLLLILFVIVHLAGNLLIYGGPEPFNAYAKKLSSLGTLKIIAEWGLFIIFSIHVLLTATLVIENIKARGISRYAVDDSRGPRSLATRLMPYSGSYFFLYLIWHLFDFTWVAHEGPRTVLQGQEMGIYGLVVNSFKDPIHAWLYVGAMGFLGLHLAHGVQSFIQSFGFNDNRFTPAVRSFSRFFALIITFAYSSIPIYVLYLLKV